MFKLREQDVFLFVSTILSFSLPLFFKFPYQDYVIRYAYIPLAIFAGVKVVELIDTLSNSRRRVHLYVLLLLVFVLPVATTVQSIPWRNEYPPEYTLSYLEYDASQWLGENSKRGEAILTSKFNRWTPFIAGRASVMSFEYAVRQDYRMWGGDIPEVALLDRFYSGGLSREDRTTLKEKGVKFVYIGKTEKVVYGEDVVDVISSYDFTKKVFGNKDVSIFKLEL
jgi:uncharacterized membrane protein